MTTPELSETAIGGIVKEHGLTVSKRENGNFQVVWAKEVMGKVKDTDKNRALYHAVEALKAQGYNAEVKFSYFIAKEKRWAPFPCIWVNKEAQASTSDISKRIDGVEALLAQLLEKLSALPAPAKAAAATEEQEEYQEGPDPF